MQHIFGQTYRSDGFLCVSLHACLDRMRHTVESRVAGLVMTVEFTAAQILSAE